MTSQINAPTPSLSRSAGEGGAKRRVRVVLLALLIAAAARADVAEKVDAVFANYAKKDAPGCAVGVSRAGKIVLERAYGMANLEYDVPLTASTIFEAGSVTKQFTAAAVLTLAADGKLSLDDPVRKYVPELPDSAAAVTIRQMLSHTSGLRDWGTIVSLAGWRRGTRLFTHAHVLEVLGRQRALNFPPGTQWSYSNSGYNLAAIVVERVSGKSFPEFTRERLFVPNGMTSSSWRDDYTRVVKGRATAYDPNRDGGYNSDMDIENIYGNCCLLTTVGDLLRWTENFRGPIRQAMETPATLSGGLKTDYGFGLFIAGDGEIWHSGATAGWRAYLSRRPKEDFSVAVLCNRGDANTGGLADKVAAAFDVVTATPAPAVGDAKPPEGLYLDKKTDAILRIKGQSIVRGPKLIPIGENRFRAGRTELRFDGDALHLVTVHKPEAVYVKVSDASPKLEDYAGSYASDEVGATYSMVVEKGKLVAKLPPVQSFELDPTYADGFAGGGGTLLHFTRDAKGRVEGVDVKTDFGATEGSARVERIHFTRLK
jgi:CubicO group peptidase (beta-lactamase class C family)